MASSPSSPPHLNGPRPSWARRHKPLIGLLFAAFSAGGYVALHGERTTKLEAQVHRIDSNTVKRDTFALFRVELLGEIRQLRAAVDSGNQRNREFFCQDRPRWCR